jgi:hypothetical protein
MKNRYEALLILNIKGKEESAKEVIERLERLSLPRAQRSNKSSASTNASSPTPRDISTLGTT